MALDAIFAADMRKQHPVDLLETTAEGQSDRQNQEEIVGYAKQIVVVITELVPEDDPVQLAEILADVFEVDVSVDMADLVPG